MENWTVELTAGRQTLAEKKNLSRHLLGKLTLATVFRYRNDATQPLKNRLHIFKPQMIIHFMYPDDIKVFVKKWKKNLKLWYKQ